MKHVDMIVKAPHFYTMQGEGVGYKDGVAMIVNGGKIEDFVPLDQIGDYQADEVLDMDHHAIFPGFIDAHAHDELRKLQFPDSRSKLLQQQTSAAWSH